MEEREIHSDSDTSDEDYMPEKEAAEAECLSEVESDDNCDDQENNELDTPKTKKRKKNAPKKVRKKKLKDEIEESSSLSNSEIKTEENEEDKKKRVDSLWADFLKDCGGPVRKGTPDKEEGTAGTKLDVHSLKVNGVKDKPPEKSETKTVITQYEFAGEKIKVEENKVGRCRLGGVAGLLDQMKNKTKLTTLEKSKLDWESFKSSQGISQQLSTYNKGKYGYLEKQDFLERTDLRQFEIEKSMRAATRSNR